MDWIVIEDIIWRHCHIFACVLLLPFIGTILSVIIQDVKNRINEEDEGYLAMLKNIILDVIKLRFVWLMVKKYFIALVISFSVWIAITNAVHQAYIFLESWELTEYLPNWPIQKLFYQILQHNITDYICILVIIWIFQGNIIRMSQKIKEEVERNLLETLKHFLKKGNFVIPKLIYCIIPKECLWNNIKPLHYACSHNNLSALKFFSRQSQLINGKDENKCTPLNLCVKLGHLKLLKFIIEGMKKRYDYSYAARSSYQSKTIKLALQNKLARDHSDDNGNSPLHVACTLGHIHIVKYLTKVVGCDPNATNKYQMSSISIALENEYMNIIRFLIDRCHCDLTICNSLLKSPIVLAVERGNLEALKLFRKFHSGEVFFEQCHVDSNNNNILHAASAHGFVEVVQYCIKELNFDINSTNNDGKSCLHLCVEHGHLEVLWYLLNNTESDITIMDGSGKSPMELATDAGYMNLIKERIVSSHQITKNGNEEINTTYSYEKCLLFFCACGHLDIVRHLIERRLCDTNCSNKQGTSCLHLAAKYGHFEIVQYLIQNTTANLAKVDMYGKSPTFIAAEAGHFRILKCMADKDKSCAFFKTSKKILLRNGKYARGSTLLHAASHGGHLEILKYLIQSCGCDYCCIDDDGIYPLYIACQMEQYKIAEYLMDKFRCDPNKRTFNGRTCLHAACTSGRSSFFENLFGRFGCSYDCVDNEGMTPLYIACEIGNITTVQHLINKKCDVTHKRYDGRSYLHAASSSGNLHIVQLLVNKFNHELNCKDNAGKTPLYIACEKGYLDLTKYFVAGKGCEPSKECFLAAETNNNIEVVDFLNDQYSIFQSSSDLNHEQKLQGNSDINHDKKCQSCTYIHKVSSQRGRLNSIKYHIKHHRCTVNRKDDDGNTPLFYACQSGDLDVVKYFISEHKFDPNQDTHCLEAACRSGKLDIVRFLIDDYKLKVCTVEKNAWSKYLHLATFSGNMPTIKYFIDVKNADPNSEGAFQWYKSKIPNALHRYTKCHHYRGNPLICACEKGHLEAVKYFTEKHNIKYPTDLIPILVASHHGHLKIVQYYIDNHYTNPDILSTATTTPLFNACLGGHLNLVKYLILEKHCNIKIKSLEGYNVVHAASESGILETVKFLKDNNCESNNRDLRGRTPLFLACLGGHTDIVKYLAAYHWDSKYVSNDGLSYLHTATIAGKLDVVKYLIDNLDIEPPSGSTAVHLACEHGHIEILQYLSKLEECNIDKARDDGMTCLHVAANYGKVDIVDYLINNTGCDINKKDKHLRSPLYLACELGYEEITKKLLANKLCDVNVKSDSGQTCLHVAVIKKHLSVMTCLLQSPKIMTNITNKEGFTPLFKACYLGYLPIVCELLQCNRCDPQVKCINRTCFHAACASGKVAVVKYLVENWSHVYDINNQDNEGVTPLFLACRQRHIKIVKYLLEKTFSDPNIKTYITQKTCFHAASESGNKKLVAYLTRMFSVSIRDAEGVTPLHIACKAGHLEVVEFLTDKLQCDCNIITNNRSSYLHEASASGKVEVIKYIIDNCNCNLNGKDCNGFTPLLVACQGSDLTSVQYLINLKDCEKTCKTNVGWSCLHVASYHGNTKLVKYLASKFQKDDIENRDNFGTTPLYLACQEGHIDIIKFLVQNKHCDLKSQAHNGWTCLHAAISTGKLEVIKCINSMTMTFFYKLLHPLHYSAIIELGCNNLLHIAAEFGQLRIVQYLIEELKFDPNSRRPDQVLPIHLASFGGHYYVVDYLANKCMCNIQSIDVHGNTPLHFAAAGGHPHMIEYFVEKYNTEISTMLNISKDSLSYHQDFPLYYYLEKMLFSDIFQDGLNKFRTTPLHCASAYGHINALKYLFDITKCGPLVKDSNKDTLLHIATRNGQLNVVKYLIENQLIKYDIEGHCKVTAVHCACAYGHLDVLKYIIEDISRDDGILTQCDENKRTPLHYACAGGCLEVVKYIRLHVICDTNSMLDRDGNSPLHLAAMYGKLEVFELLMGSSITDRKYTPRMFNPSTKNLKKKRAIDLAHSKVKCDIYGYFINEETKDAAFQTPNSLSLASSLNIIVFGSRKVGKSSLIKALSTNRKFDWLFSFPMSHTTTYKEYGCVTFYDTLSDERYHNGYSVILQQIHHPLVIVVISLSQSIEDIVTQLAYWFKLITDAGTCSHEVSDVIIVGSRSDKHATSYKESNINSTVKDYINNNAYCYKGSVFCDRRYSPEDMTLLHNLIASVRNERISAHDTNETASTQKLSPTLFRYLQHLSTYLVSITLKELIKKAKNIECPDTNMIKLFDVTELNKTCQYLHSHGRISYFQHDENIENNVIILHEELLLMLFNFYLMTNLDEFKDGVMEVSHLKATICESFSPNMFDTDLAIKYLQSHHFCSEISYDVLNAIKHVKIKSRYFFFHKMIFTDRPRPDNSELWYPDASGKETIWSVLCLKCKNDHFFNPQYLHALYIKIINREKDVDYTTLWNTGIGLVHASGTRSIIEVTDLTSKIYLVIQCKDNLKLKLVEQRSKLFSMIKSLIKIVCFNVEYSEYILYMDQNVYPPKNFKEISISKVADALVKDVDNVVLDYSSEIELSKFLHKDFFKEAKRQDSFQLVQNRNLDKSVPTDLQSRLCNLFKEQFHTGCADGPLSYKYLYNKAIKFSIFTDRPVYEVCEVSLDSEFYEDSSLNDSTSSSAPSLSDLTCLRYDNGDKCLRILDSISHEWIKAGDLLGLTPECLKGIDLKHRGDVHMCCRDVLVHWLQDNLKNYPPTWECMKQLLKDMELSTVAIDLQNALNLKSI